LGLKLECSPGEVFYEADACLLVEVRPEHVRTFEAALQGLPYRKAGVVSPDDGSLGSQRLRISHAGQVLVDIDVPALVQAWKRADLDQTNTNKSAGKDTVVIAKDRLL
jgi:hypothetical protein